MPDIRVIIPAQNEAETLPMVLAALNNSGEDITEVIVVDNGSTDGSGEIASNLGATVVREDTAGYGRACLAGIAAAKEADILVFLDADFCDDPKTIHQLTGPIAVGKADMVLSSRLHGTAKNALTLPQRWGNWLAAILMHLFWGVKYTDLGPFRAISNKALESLKMQDKAFGWTVEMQVRAAKKKLRIIEIPLPYQDRPAGKSKISGTVSGVFKAGTTILYVIGREVFRPNFD